MIKEITSILDLDKLLRKEIITQSELSSEFVVNATSVRGPDIEKNLTDDIFDSIDMSDTLIIFEIITDDSSNNVSMIEEDDTLTSYSSFILKLIMYGETSKTVSQKLKARFETENVKTKLSDIGIHIDNISNITQINEFKNNTVWTRNDLNIEFSCRLSFKQIDSSQYIENINIINIKEE